MLEIGSVYKWNFIDSTFLVFTTDEIFRGLKFHELNHNTFVLILNYAPKSFRDKLSVVSVFHNNQICDLIMAEYQVEKFLKVC